MSNLTRQPWQMNISSNDFPYSHTVLELPVYFPFLLLILPLSGFSIHHCIQQLVPQSTSDFYRHTSKAMFGQFSSTVDHPALLKTFFSLDFSEYNLLISIIETYSLLISLCRACRFHLALKHWGSSRLILHFSIQIMILSQTTSPTPMDPNHI